MSPDEYLTAITASGVLAPEIERNLAAWSKAMAASVDAISGHAQHQKWLSAYQCERILKGKGHKLKVGPYILQGILGEGGMGRVFRARHARMGREVALKVIRKERLSNKQTIRRFQQEVKAVGALVHPNIVLAIDADSAGHMHYVAMELIDGKDLYSLVRDHGPMPMPVACEYARQVAIGLQHAFEKGMVHRDIKPSNLMVTKGGVVKILDFGLAMLNEPDAGGERVTIEGFVIGTPDFLAPEQAHNPRGVDTRADLYALGGTLYFLLAGKIPYDGPTATAKLLRHANEPPPLVRMARPDLPPQLEGLIAWLMAKDPVHRPQVPMQVAMALQPFCQPVNLLAPPPPGPESSSQAFRIPDASSPRRARKPTKSAVPMLVALFATVAVIVVLALVALNKIKH